MLNLAGVICLCGLALMVVGLDDVTSPDVYLRFRGLALASAGAFIGLIAIILATFEYIYVGEAACQALKKEPVNPPRSVRSFEQPLTLFWEGTRTINCSGQRTVTVSL